jgi:hypothetical protein
MQVGAVSTPSSTGWRWRIVDYSGVIIEESREPFPTIAAAVANGTKRLVQMNVVDHSVAPRLYRTRSRASGR